MIHTARCDMENCQTIIKPQEGDELYSVGEMQICKECYTNRYSDLTEEYLEDEDGDV